MPYVIQIEGSKEMERAMKDLPLGVSQFLQGPGCAAAARVIARQLRKTVPVKTGALKKSVRVARIPDYYQGRKVPRGRALVIYGGRGARQAPLLEFGTVRIPAKHYLRRATEHNREGQHQAFLDGTAKAYNKFARDIRRGNINRRLGSVIDG